MSNLDQIILEVIRVVLAGIVGGLIGARANDRLTRHRDRDAGIANRRREFLAFMAQAKAEALGTHPAYWWEFYHNKRPNVRHEIEMIIGDLSARERAELEDLASAACDLNEIQIHNRQGIMENLEKITVFVKELPN